MVENVPGPVSWRVLAPVISITILALWLAAARPVNFALLTVAAIVAASLIATGFAAASRFGRDMPLGSAREIREGGPGEATKLLIWSGLLGFVLGLVILGILVFCLAPLEPALATRLRSRAGAPMWLPVALAFESSVLEEVFFRLFLLSCLVWLAARGWRRDVHEAPRVVVWSAIGISSVAFGLAHLPPWSSVSRATPLVICSVLGLNVAAGIVLGRVYWRWGLPAAIVCHFAADLAVQGLGPRLLA